MATCRWGLSVRRWFVPIGFMRMMPVIIVMIVVMIMIVAGMFLMPGRVRTVLHARGPVRAQLDRQQRNVSGDHRGFQCVRGIRLFKRVHKLLGRGMAQGRALADAFQQFNRIRHVFPLPLCIQESV